MKKHKAKHDVEDAIKRLVVNPQALMWKNPNVCNFTLLHCAAYVGSENFIGSLFKVSPSLVYVYYIYNPKLCLVYIWFVTT